MAVTEIVKRMGKPMHGILSTTAIEILELLLFFHDKMPERLLIFTDTNISILRTEVYYCRLLLLRNALRSSKQKILYFNHMKTQV
jgi:hypothetical protein